MSRTGGAAVADRVDLSTDRTSRTGGAALTDRPDFATDDLEAQVGAWPRAMKKGRLSRQESTEPRPLQLDLWDDAASQAFGKRIGTSGEETVSPLAERFSQPAPPDLNISARQARRRIARLFFKQQEDECLQERQRLLDKRRRRGLTPREEHRLTYVRWQLERIDDAELGDAMDELEMLTLSSEGFARALEEYGRAFKKATRPRKPPNQRRR